MQTFNVVPSSSELSSAKQDEILVERRFVSLDGWRGLAILSVFFYHYSITTNANQLWVKIVAWVGGAGWFGVDLFFVLSGFLITGILLDTREHRHYFRNFYMRRALRIFPLYYGILFGLLLLTPILHLQWRWGHIAYFLYVGNIAPLLSKGLGTVSPGIVLGHTWSLAVEEQFYLIWPFIVAWISGRKTLIRIAVTGMVLGLLLRAILLVTLNQDDAIGWSYNVLPMRCDGLLCGAIAAILLRQGTLAQASKIFRWPALIGVVGTLAIYIYDGNANFGHPLASLFLHTCLSLAFASLLLSVIRPGTWGYRVGMVRWLRFFGKYSYGIYVIHRLIDLRPLLYTLQSRLHSKVVGSVAFFGIVFVGTTLLAVLSYELYERHFLKLKSRFSYSAERAA